MGAAGVTALSQKVIPSSKPALPVIVSELLVVDRKPDGDLKKPMWSGAKSQRFDQAAFSDARYPDIETRVASCWSAEFLYIAFWCPYRTLTVYEGEDAANERWRLWERDVVEAFINPRPQAASHYYEFEVAPNNQWLDLEIDLTHTPFNNASWNSGFEHATKIDTANRVWTAEMRIPVRSMGVEAIRPSQGPNDDWRINFYRCDGAGGDDVRHMLSWGRLPVRGPGGSFHQPESFGGLRFSAARARAR